MRAASIIASIAVLLFTANQSVAQLRPYLGAASTFAVFTGSGAINITGASVLTGDVGYNTGSLTGLPPGIVTGTRHLGDATSALALQALINAQTAEGLVACGTVLGTLIVDGQSFNPGVYCSGGATTAAGNITFNAHGNGNAIFIVKIGGAFATGASTHILLANNARAANIYWFVDGAVAVANSSSIKGTIIANGKISFAGTSSLDGRALASPAGEIDLAANNMAMSTDSGTANNLTVVRPASGDSILKGTLRDTITWTGTGIARVKTLQYSLDSGRTWTTIATINNDSFAYIWHVPDTTSTKALVRVTDTNSLSGVSGFFKIILNKIIVVAPAAGALITGGTLHDTITWTGTGLNHIKTFALSLDSGLTWITIGKDTTNGFIYLWNVTDTVSAKAVIRITDSNGVTGKSGIFTIRSSKIIVTHPALAESIKGGTQTYQITWIGTGLTSRKIFKYSLDSGLTWKTIDTIRADIFTHTWNVPDTVSTRAVVSITDSNGITGQSGVFTIKSSKVPGGIAIIRPALGETITGGTLNYQIYWSGTGIASTKTFDYSLDSGATWKLIGTISADVFAYGWNVLDSATTRAMVRITDANGMTGKSSVFTIRSSKSPGRIVVVSPARGERIAAGTLNYQITWTGTSIAAKKTFDLSLDGGVTWSTIGTMTSDALTYSWNVPDTGSTQAIIRITDSTGTTGMSGVFTIVPTPGTIAIVLPTPGEVIDGGTPNFLITFTASHTTPQKTIEYSLDGGATWSLIGFLNSEALSYSWSIVPNVATTQARVRITDGNGVIGTSGLFTIKIIPGVGSINSITLSGLDNNKNIGNNKKLGISWAYTPEIGTSVEVEYSLDYMVTWILVGTVPVSESPDSTTWMTTGTGYYNPVFIRVTSTLGMTRTSAAFSIGSNASVSSNAAVNGYSVSNYPNPSSGQTTINVVLPIRSDVTLTVVDNLGRQVSVVSQTLEAGTHDIPFDAAQLADGVYTYMLVAGTTRVSGRMSIIR